MDADTCSKNTCHNMWLKATPWLVLSCGWIFYLYEYMLRVSPSAITSELMLTFGVNATNLGILVSFYYLSYVFLQIPCGLIVDTLGARFVVTVSSLICAVGTFIFSQSETLYVAQLGRFLMGAGSACAYLSCAKIVSQWFSKEKFPFIMGVSMSIGTFGATFGAKPFAYLSNHIGWRETMIVAAIIGIIIMVLAWLFIKTPPNYKQPSITKNEWAASWKDLCTIAMNPQSWIVGGYGCLTYLSLTAFAELWGVPYVMQKYSLTNDKATLASVIFFVGFGIGSVISARIANTLQSYRKTLMWSSVICCALLLFEFYGPSMPFGWAVFIFAIAGVASGWQILYFTMGRDNSPPEAHSTSVGFMNFCVAGSGLIFPTLLGWILDLVWDGKMTVNGTPEYSVGHYKTAFAIVCLAFIVSAALIMRAKETYPKETPLNEKVS